MRAVQADQTRPPLIVAEQRQLFAEDFHFERRAARRQLFAQRHRLPVTPHQFAAWRSAIGLG